MSHDDRTAQEQLTPDERRTLLRAFADRMLLKVSAMDDPEDLPGVEKAMRVAAVIERVYSRCDRSEAKGPDPRKLAAERADNEREAIKARVNLADTLQWGEERRQKLGKWWDAAQSAVQPAPVRIPAALPTSAAPEQKSAAFPLKDIAPACRKTTRLSPPGHTDALLKVQARPDLKNIPADALKNPAESPARGRPPPA